MTFENNLLQVYLLEQKHSRTRLLPKKITDVQRAEKKPVRRIHTHAPRKKFLEHDKS